MPDGPTVKGRTLLGFDFGTVRIGVAVGNSISGTARPLEIIAFEDNARRFARIQDLIAQWQPDALVVGMPCHPDGQPHDMTARCQKFAHQLSGRFSLPVHTVDERYTSVQAQHFVKPGQRVDAHAAALILESYLAESP